MKKLFLFDIDGTLSVNLFSVNGEILSCIGDFNQWTKYAATHENCYSLCEPLDCVNEFIKYIVEHDGICYALTTDTNSYSFESKSKFVNKCYPDIKKVVSVSEDIRKIDMIKYIAQNEHVHIEDCVLIEDTLATMVAAQNAGIKAWHITHVMRAKEKEIPWASLM